MSTCAPAARPAGAAAFEPPSTSASKLVVGCALLPKKIRRYLTEDFVRMAKGRNLELRVIDRSKPLDEQGPFHVILHKLLCEQQWVDELTRYVRSHPLECAVIDEPGAIGVLASRHTMLSELQKEAIALSEPPPAPAPAPAPPRPPKSALVKAPSQITVQIGLDIESVLLQIKDAGLSFPLIAKPIVSCGSEECHLIALVKSETGLRELMEGDNGFGAASPRVAGMRGGSNPTPNAIVLQEYIEHGGVLFKVYIIGEKAVLCPRPSIQRQDLAFEDDDSPQGMSRDSSTQATEAYAEDTDPSPRLNGPSSELKFFSGVSRRPRALSDPTAVTPEPGESPGRADDAPETFATGGGAGATPPVMRFPSQCQPGVAGVSGLSRGFGSAMHLSTPLNGSRTSLELMDMVSSPPDWVVQGLGRALRERLGLQLFNIDLLCPRGPGYGPATYFVVDCNYFPGIDKLSGWEELLLDFLEKTAMGVEQRRRAERRG